MVRRTLHPKDLRRCRIGVEPAIGYRINHPLEEIPGASLLNGGCKPSKHDVSQLLACPRLAAQHLQHFAVDRAAHQALVVRGPGGLGFALAGLGGGAKIMPGVELGPFTIVAAGAGNVAVKALPAVQGHGDAQSHQAGGCSRKMVKAGAHVGIGLAQCFAAFLDSKALGSAAGMEMLLELFGIDRLKLG